MRLIVSERSEADDYGYYDWTNYEYKEEESIPSEILSNAYSITLTRDHFSEDMILLFYKATCLREALHWNGDIMRVKLRINRKNIGIIIYRQRTDSYE